jgi:maltooligosyltrehalose trehalohydrolase
VPDPNDEATFQSSKLRWDEIAEHEHTQLLDWYATLARLRADALTTSGWPTDDFVVRFDEGARWLALRVKGVSALFNFGSSKCVLEIPTLDLGATPARARRTLVSGDNIRVIEETVSLPPAGTLVWQC